MGIDSYLEDAREDGDHDSQGVFTLALDKAKAKLAAFRLADPSKFPQFLVSCATLSGAGKFDAVEKRTLGGWNCTYTFNGDALTREDLLSLRASVTGAELSRKLRALGVVLDTLGAEHEVLLSSGDGESVIAIRVADRSMEFVNPGPDKIHGTRLKVEGLGSSYRPSAWDLACQHSSMSIELNGQLVSRSFDPGVTSDTLFGCYHLVGSESLRVRPPSIRRQDLFSHRARSSGHRTLILGLATKPHCRELALRVVVDGVARKILRGPKFFPYICGRVTDSQLNFDLSGQGLMDDEASEELRVFLDASIDDFLIKFCSDDFDVPDEVRPLFLHWLGERYPPESDRPTEISDYMGKFYVDGSPKKKNRKRIVPTREPGSRQSHRQAASTSRKKGRPALVLRHLIAERTHLRGQKKRCSETEELIRCFQFLQGDASSRYWAEETLPDESASQGSRFRALLMHLEKFKTEEILHWLEVLEIPSAWAAWIRFELAMQDKSADFETSSSDIALQILPFIVQWEIEGANEGFEQIKALRNRFYEPGDYKLWLDFLWRCYRGRMSLLRSERLRLTLTFLRPTQTELPGFTRERPYPRQSELLQLVNSRIDDDHFVIDLLFTLHALRAERRGDARRILAKVLLQGSFGELNRPLSALEELPREPFHC